MDFTNKEILKHLVEPLRKYEYLDIRMYTDDEEEIFGECEGRIQCITFDGAVSKAEFFIQFYETHANIILFNLFDGFRIIDDTARGWCGETFDDMIIYEGNLIDKTPAEILGLLREVIFLVAGATNIEVERHILGVRSYEVCDYIIKITSKTNEKKEIVFDNIKFIINGHLESD